MEKSCTESVSTLSSLISSGYSPSTRSTNHRFPSTGVCLIDDRNPSTGLERGLFDQVSAMAMVKSKAGTNPKKVYSAYRVATDNNLPAVEDS